jgi:kynurenine formamidase
MAKLSVIPSTALRAGGYGLSAILVLVLSACGTATDNVPTASIPNVVDLSHVVREDMPLAPGDPQLRIDRDPPLTLTIGARSGTSLRVLAPVDASVTTVEQLSPVDLVLPAIMIDVRDLVAERADLQIDASDLLAWEQQYSRIADGTLVLFATGWDLRWGDPPAYLNRDASGTLMVPQLTPAALGLLEARGVAGVGIDAPAELPPPAQGFRLLLTNLQGVEQLPPIDLTVVIGALRLQDAADSPARVMVLLPQ